MDPDIKHPRVDEWTVGIQRALTKDIRAEVTGIWREDKNIQASVYPDARWAPTTVTNGVTGQRLTVYNWVNVAASQNTPILTNPDGFVYRDIAGNPLGTARAERKYTGVMLVLDKRFSNRWQGRVSYVWSEIESSINNTGSNSYGADGGWTPCRCGGVGEAPSAARRRARPGCTRAPVTACIG